jgi:hypothetical protein
MDRGYKSGPDTTYNYDTNVGSPDILKLSSLYAAEQYDYCPQAAMGLSYNWSSMTALVNNISPNGNTNQTISLQVGWMSIAGGGPFSVPPMDSNYTYQQLIILLMDGLNTEDRWYTTELHRYAAKNDLRQHQGGQNHALHHPGQHRRRSDLDAVAELRQLVGQILPAHLGKRHRDRVQSDWHQLDQTARRQIAPESAPAGRIDKWGGLPFATLLFVPSAAILAFVLSWLLCKADRTKQKPGQTSRASLS